jgi:hypothetical protein
VTSAVRARGETGPRVAAIVCTGMDVSGFPSGSFPVLKISVRKDTLMDAAQGTACALCASPVSRRVSIGRKRLLSQAMLTLGLALACVLQGHAQQMAITFDDLPLHGPMAPGQTRLEIAQSILKTLAANHMPPTYGFVNGFRVPRYPETLSVLEAWRNAGQLLGNPQHCPRRGSARTPAAS